MIAPSRSVGAALDRLDGPQKVAGEATYAFEYAFDRVAYAFVVQSTIAKGRIVRIDDDDARALPGVLTVRSHANAPRLDAGIDGKLKVLQSDRGVNPIGIKGIGEIGIVGVAAAMANAVQHATGVRVRALPITPDALLCDPAWGSADSAP